MSLDVGTFTLINWTVKPVLRNLALAVIYGLITVIHAKRIALTFPVKYIWQGASFVKGRVISTTRTTELGYR